MEALVVLKLGLMCSSDAPVSRPSMRGGQYLDGENSLPEVLAPPGGYVWKKDVSISGDGGSVGEFEGYLHSYPESSYLENMSTLSTTGDVGARSNISLPT
ncbi:hypothetical protein Droror1_Dr00004961 [Drosera rotundifolia]